MPKMLKGAALAACAGTVLTALLYGVCGAGLFLTLAITFGTAGYHLTMRLAVGGLVDRRMRNRADCARRWYRPRRWEAPLYRALRVKSWKRLLPSYEPELFSLRAHTPEEIAQAMCQSEIVHELDAGLSFVPLLAIPRFGSPWVFALTSAGAACFDLMFAIVQRYNRPRMLRLAQKRRGQ